MGVVCSACNSFYHNSCCQLSPAVLNEYIKSDKYIWKCAECVNPNPIVAGKTGLNAMLLSMKADIDTLKAKQNEFIRQQTDFATSLSSISEKLINLIDLEKKVNDNANNIMTIQTDISKFNIRNETLFRENALLKKEMINVINRSEQLERFCYSSNLQVYGVPEAKNENLSGCILNIFHFLGAVNIAETDFKYVHRTRTKSTARPITVEFTSKFKKDYAFQCYKLKKSFPASEIGFNSDFKVFVVEHLSPAKKHLLYEAKKSLQNKDAVNRYKYVWTSHGNIYCKKSDSDKPTIISTLVDLTMLQ